jgi:hypothetical protein
LHIDATVFDLSAYSFRARATFEDFGLRLGRPPDFPLALAATSPAMVRSLMRLRSNSASAPKMWKTSWPVAEEVSMFSVMLRKAICWDASPDYARPPVVTEMQCRNLCF